MKRRIQTLTVLLSLLLLPALATMASAQTADEIVQKHIAAIGGREALAKLTTRKATGTISVSTPAAVLAGSMEAYTKAPNKTHNIMRLDLTPVGATGEMVVEQIFDGERGYSLNSMQGNTDVVGRQLDAMRNNQFPSGLLTYKEHGVTLEMLPKDQVHGRPAFVIKATPKVGAASKLYFDAETYLIVRSVTTVDNPAGGDLEQIGELSDYRTVDGVKLAFKIVNTTDLQTVTITLSKIEHNVPIDDAMFVKK